jgi:hypothetical protein
MSRYVALSLASTLRSGEGGHWYCLGRCGRDGERRAEGRDGCLSVVGAIASTRRGRKVEAPDGPLSEAATRLAAWERMGAAWICTGCLRAAFSLTRTKAASLSLVVRDEVVEGRGESNVDSLSSRSNLGVRLP